jgi:hypothetical protein
MLPSGTWTNVRLVARAGWSHHEQAWCATGFAEEQLANTIARQGGLGLGKMIEQSLRSGSR